MDSPSEHLQSRGWWADQIKHMIERAEADGYYVQVANECCGCSRMGLVIGSEEDEREVLIYGHEYTLGYH